MTPWLLGWVLFWLVAGQVVPVMAGEVAIVPVEPRFLCRR